MDIQKDNERLLALLSGFLNWKADAVTPELMGELTAGGLSEAEAWPIALAGFLGLDIADSPADRAFFERYLRGNARVLDPGIYAADPYLTAVSLPEERLGRWEWRELSYAPFEAFVCGDMTLLPDGRIRQPIGCFPSRFRYPAVLEDGREWMTVTPNEIETMRPAIGAARGNALAFGLGLGYFAFHASEKPEVTGVTVVERNEDAADLFRRCILPQFPRGEKIRIVVEDAFAFARRELPKGGWDFIFTDLWHDVSDGIPLYQRMRALEPLSPGSAFAYWIEPTLRCYLRGQSV